MSNATESVETLIIGGGQAGLAVAYYLKKQKRPFVILDANDRVGDAWRNRWDSLRLFTPARFSGLPGMRFPARGDAFPTKDEMADYLESYSAHFGLEVRSGARVDQLCREGELFVVRAGAHTFEAKNVVVAMSNYQQPRIPGFASDLDPEVIQLHSREYRSPSQLRAGRVLIVGAGNSGADIAMEVAASHPTLMAGTEYGHIPLRIEKFFMRNILIHGVRFVGHHVLTLRTPAGRKARPSFLANAAPLVRVKPKDLDHAGIERVGRIAGVHDGVAITDDGRQLPVENVIWCTGFRPGFSWIDLPVLGDRQEPTTDWGVVPAQPGLYFVGLDFLYAATSDTITGVGRDAHRVVRHLVARRQATAPSPAADDAALECA